VSIQASRGRGSDARAASDPRSAGEDGAPTEAFLRVDRPEVLDDLEAAFSGVRDVHAQAGVVLTRAPSDDVAGEQWMRPRTRQRAA
jgi:hypothetical protein